MRALSFAAADLVDTGYESSVQNECLFRLL